MRAWHQFTVTVAVLLCAACGAEGAAPGETAAGPLQAGETTLVHEERPLAGTTFSIDVVSGDPARAKLAIEAAFAEVSRLEGVVSEWSADSEISAVNAAAMGRPVTVSAELYGVINRALWFAELTGGAFDPSFAGCASLWSIPERRIPSGAELAACVERTGFGGIRLDPMSSTVTLVKPGMRIGLGGIGKGYRVDRAAEILEAHGQTSYVVNGGGDIRLSAGDLRPPWQVDIIHPRDTSNRLGSITLKRGAIATSGDTSWYFEQDGKRYHHIFDPRNGEPARRSIAVTVIADRAIDADALATGLFVMGPEQGLALLGDLPGYEALLVGPALDSHTTPGFPALSFSD